MPLSLYTPVREIPKIGPQSQKRLKRLNIETVGQLIFHFPHRYEDFSNLIPVAQAQIGGPFCFLGKITDIKNIRTFKRRMMLTQATLEDATGKLKVMWFNQPYLINSLKKDTPVCLAGKISAKGNQIYLSNPAYERILDGEDGTQNIDLTHTGRLIPVYPETEGLSSKWLRFIVKPILEKLKNQIPDSLPPELSRKYGFLPISKAIWQIHFPDSLAQAEQAKKRFSYEELLELSLFMMREKMKLKKEKAIAVPINLDLMKEFVDGLPYTLTDAQKKSAWQILKDLEKNKPMNRLLEGDVGSGKTVVAAMAILNTAKAGYQTAFLIPTEILVKQHFQTISKVLKKYKVNVGLLTGKQSYFNSRKIAKKDLLKKVSEGKVDVLIGTHAIIQDTTPRTPEQTPAQFKNLALVIVDEQHRFGVEQRAKLCRQKDFIPHLLSMTATPIPRTLSLTIFGDLDLSLIDEMPKGRKKIITKIIKPKDKKETYDFVREKVKEGRQVFVICPRIEPPKAPTDGSDARNLSWMDVKAVKQEYEKFSEEVFPDLKVAMLHGRMKSEEKEKIMKKFKEGKTNILVSTSVIEVGVDVPNATVMIIEGAEKFGLAQLHQFRGRVGRSDFQSYCFLFVDTTGIVYNRRLRALVNLQDGFELAEKDLQIRGPGDFIGQRQWGIPDLAMASLTDATLVSRVREDAKKLLEDDPKLEKYPVLKDKIRDFQKRIHLE